MIQAMSHDIDEDVRAGWTWIVDNPGPENLSWNLWCVVSFPMFFGSVTEDTRTFINQAVIIARPVASVINQ